MTTKTNSHHIVGLSLMPICRTPNGSYGGQFGFLLRNRGLEPKVNPLSHAVEFIDHGPTGILAVVIHCTQVEEEVKTQLALGEGTDLHKGIGSKNDQSRLPAEFRGCRQAIGKPIA